MNLAVVAAANDQLPEDVGKAGPIGLLIIVLLLIVTAFLVKSMGRHLKRVPASFDPPEVVVPDDASELFEQKPEPGQDLLDTLRRAPRAIEPPRDDRPVDPDTRG
jgi:hypothetical protein